MKNEKKKLLALKKTTETLEFELCLKSCFETIVREIVDEDSRGIHGKRNGIEEVPMRLLRALHALRFGNFRSRLCLAKRGRRFSVGSFVSAPRTEQFRHEIDRKDVQAYFRGKCAWFSRIYRDCD